MDDHLNSTVMTRYHMSCWHSLCPLCFHQWHTTTVTYVKRIGFGSYNVLVRLWWKQFWSLYHARIVFLKPTSTGLNGVLPHVWPTHIWAMPLLLLLLLAIECSNLQTLFGQDVFINKWPYH